MSRRSYAAAAILWGILAVFFFPRLSHAETCAETIGKAVSVQGDVQALRQGETQWRTVRLNDTYCPDDTIRVQERSRADIMLTNDSVLRLDQKTAIVFSGKEKEKTFLINLQKGIAHFFSRFRRSLKVTTPFVNATVEGTEFLVKVETDQTFMSVFEGKVEFTNDRGTLLIASGQSAVASAGQIPALKVVAKPRDAVQWTLYYLPVFSYQPSEVAPRPGAEWRAKVSSLLFVGRVDEAKAEVEQALKAAPGNSDALAVASVIAVAQNDKEKAFGLGMKAVEANPDSAAARIAISYAQQARFDLEGALESLKEAVKSEPNNALAWARLSELWLSFGNRKEALDAAKKAASLSPESARAQTVLGFAHLMEVETKEAKEAFEKAVMLDQADPLPRLGLGLATIREGRLAEGRNQIEIAETLNPDSSLIRSYLGKAYYEEKRDEKAAEQFIKAEEFDPLDPTPLFYDAIRKQSINRPVEALHDLQKAIELNDNREVYRSKFLLDEDLAARSASLSSIYSDLGFQQLAFEEAAKSVNTDPGNYSAHRFLSDSYAALPRHEIARVSELLQSQLLQPINITPVRPQSAESNLFILEGAGPSDPSFNEFNPLFNRNRIALQMSGVAGGSSTFGDEMIASGVYDKFSFSAGQFHYQTEGFRANNDQKQNIYDLFAQYSFSEKTSIQAEFRYRDVEKGFLRLLFDPNDFYPDERDKEHNRSVRLGLHHSFAPGSDLVVSAIYRNANFEEANVFGPGLDYGTKRDGFTGEIQHLFSTEIVRLISGAGHFQDRLETSLFGESTTTHPRHTNIYVYSLINYPKNVTWTIGGSGDFLKSAIADQTIERNQFNPKFGVTWSPFSGTALRAAAFKTVARGLVTDQTIEPTQVAGFNQFFDDAEGTKSWRYGIGIDQKFLPQLYGGVEVSKRDLDVFGLLPDFETGGTQLIERRWEERLGRAYLYWTPHPWLSLSTEYQFEGFKRPEDFAGDNITKLNTHRVLLGVGFFHPSGLFAQFKPTYISQDGKFIQVLGPEPWNYNVVSKSDQFWVFDASIGYRLPKRLGIFSITAKNLFNKTFNFQDTDPYNPTIQPKRLILAKLTLAF
ncbi:MAG: TonB-dependent receptor [Nitrospirae bacterium]|nr:TonB-dependent receptor [Nitrospirota bacterium]